MLVLHNTFYFSAWRGLAIVPLFFFYELPTLLLLFDYFLVSDFHSVHVMN